MIFFIIDKFLRQLFVEALLPFQLLQIPSDHTMFSGSAGTSYEVITGSTSPLLSTGTANF